MYIPKIIADIKEEASQWRRTLHQNPQTSYEEEFASHLIAEKLSAWKIPFKKGIAKTGIVASLEGKKKDSGKTIGLRADMDALNITENSGQPWASKNPGKMHACGHDGHTATLLGVAKYLQETRNFNGKVHLIFQPAEEGGKGAHKMIEEGLFYEFPCDYVFALHNWPWLSLGKIATRVGPLLASASSFKITITGKGGHAAMPHLSVDPIIVASQVVMALQTIVSRNVDPIETAVVSVSNINAGTGAFNIIGSMATLDGTIRAFHKNVAELLRERVICLSQNICTAFGATAEVEFMEGIDPTINTPDGVTMAARAAASVVGEGNVDVDFPPCMGGEDFGAMLAKNPGAFVFIGQREEGKEKSPHNQGLHNPSYDFNDEALPVGMSYFVALVEQNMPLDQ